MFLFRRTLIKVRRLKTTIHTVKLAKALAFPGQAKDYIVLVPETFRATVLACDYGSLYQWSEVLSTESRKQTHWLKFDQVRPNSQ